MYIKQLELCKAHTALSLVPSLPDLFGDEAIPPPPPQHTHTHTHTVAHVHVHTTITLQLTMMQHCTSIDHDPSTLTYIELKHVQYNRMYM